MIDDMYFVNMANETMHWNENPNGNGYFAVEELQMELDIRSQDRNRMQMQGIWPSYTYFGKMVIHISGHLLADTPAQLNVYKLQLMRILMPPRTGLAFYNKIGTFYIKYTGINEYYYTECGLEAAPDIQIGALSPSNVPCSLSLKSFLPYMWGASTGQRVWVA